MYAHQSLMGAEAEELQKDEFSRDFANLDLEYPREFLDNLRVTADGDWLCLQECGQEEEGLSLAPNFSFDPTGTGAGRDPMLMERKNLINLLKIIVKEVIECSMIHGGVLESDHMPLQHFLAVLEHALQHGLKPKRGLLGPRKELWDLLQEVDRLMPEAQEITLSVRELPTVKSSQGRARAWLRLALMQKRLADYVKCLADHRDDLLCHFYESRALMMSEDAVVLTGLLLGLNVIDCNICLKEEDLDLQQGVIDFSAYLKKPSIGTRLDFRDVMEGPPKEINPNGMAALLEQKNYLEELNRHLSSTVADLQARIETLMTTNSLLKQDMAISKSRIMQLGEENRSLRNQLQKKSESCKNSEDSQSEGKSSSDNALIREGGDGAACSPPVGIGRNEALNHSHTVVDLKKKLLEEEAQSSRLQRELDLQVAMKNEMEVAMKLLEKDTDQKEETIASLRQQLEEVQDLNMEMFQKLQECEFDIKQKTDRISKLHEKTIQVAAALTRLEQYDRDKSTLDELRRTSAASKLGRSQTATPSSTASSNLQQHHQSTNE